MQVLLIGIGSGRRVNPLFPPSHLCLALIVLIALICALVYLVPCPASFGFGRGQIDPIAPDDYDTAGPHHVTYHLTCGVFLVSCPSSDVRPHLQWTHGMLGMAAMSMCLSSCLTLSLLIGIKLRLPGGASPS